jgi:hypothetical protein
MQSKKDLTLFTDDELRAELEERNAVSKTSFIYFLKQYLIGKKVSGGYVKNVTHVKKHITEPDTQANDWWGSEYDINVVKIVFEDKSSIEIKTLEQLLDLDLY